MEGYWLGKVIEDMEKEPCENCILRPICMNKTWKDIVDRCHLILDYLCDNASYEKSVHPPWGHVIHIESLEKSFNVTVSATNNEMFAIGECWRKDKDSKRSAVDGDWEEVVLTSKTNQQFPPPTMLMKTYKRKKKK